MNKPRLHIGHGKKKSGEKLNLQILRKRFSSTYRGEIDEEILDDRVF